MDSLFFCFIYLLHFTDISHVINHLKNEHLLVEQKAIGVNVA